MAINPFHSRLIASLRIAARVNMLLASEETREEKTKIANVAGGKR